MASAVTYSPSRYYYPGSAPIQNTVNMELDPIHNNYMSLTGYCRSTKLCEEISRMSWSGMNQIGLYKKIPLT